MSLSLPEGSRQVQGVTGSAPERTVDPLITCRAFPFETTTHLLRSLTPNARLALFTTTTTTPSSKQGKPDTEAVETAAAAVEHHFASLVSELPVTCAFVSSFYSGRSHLVEEWIHVADADVPWGASLVAVALHWGDQGWGNQEGAIRLCVGRGVDAIDHDEAWANILDEGPNAGVHQTDEEGNTLAAKAGDDLVVRSAPRPPAAEVFAFHIPHSETMSSSTPHTDSDRSASGFLLRKSQLPDAAQPKPLPLQSPTLAAAPVPTCDCAPTAFLIAAGAGGIHELSGKHGAVVLSFLGRDIGAALDRRFLRTLLPHHDEGEEDHAPHHLPPMSGQGHQAVMQAATAHLTPSARCRIARLAAEAGAGSPLPLLVASLCRMRPLLRRYVLEWAFPIPHAALSAALCRVDPSGSAEAA